MTGSTSYNNSVNKDYIMITHKALPLTILFVSILLFSIVYHHLENWYDESEKKKRLSVTDSIWYSVSTQSLLGLGDITPRSATTKMISALQVLITVGVLFYILQISRRE